MISTFLHATIFPSRLCHRRRYAAETASSHLGLSVWDAAVLNHITRGAAYSLTSEVGLTLLRERCDAFLIIAAFAKLLVGMPLDLETYVETRVIRRIQYALDRRERDRRHFCERIDEVVKDALKRRCVIGNPRDQAQACASGAEMRRPSMIMSTARVNPAMRATR